MSKFNPFGDPRPVSIVDGALGARRVAVLATDVPPGGRRTLTVRILAPGPGGPDPRLWTTPIVRPWSIKPVSVSPCPRSR